MEQDKMLEQKEIERLRKFCKSILKENADCFDVNHEIDRSLNIFENEQILKKKIQERFPRTIEYSVGTLKKDLDTFKEKEDNEEKQEFVEIENKTKKEFDKEIEGIINNKISKLDKYFEPLRNYIKAVATSKGYLNSLFICSRGGLGKSTILLKTLKELDIDYKYTNNYSTCVELVNFLYQNKNKQIVFDDIESMFKMGEKVINIFKGSLWGIGKNNKRVVSYLTCYSDNTETLTPNGIKLIKELKIGEEVYTINPKTEKLELKPIIALLSKEGKNYNKLIQIKSRHINLEITPNHKMLVRFKKPRGWSEIKEIKAEELLHRNHFAIPLIVKSYEEKRYNILEGYNNKDMLELIGWYITEGSLNYQKKAGHYGIYIYEPTEKYLKELKNLCERIKIKYSITKRENGTNKALVISNKKLYDFLVQFGKGAYNKNIPSKFLELPKEELKILFNTLIKGDGHKGKNDKNAHHYVTISPKLAEDMIELGLKLGNGIMYKKENMKGKIMSYINGRAIKSNYEVYRLNIRYERLSGHIITKKHITIIPNKKKVWCVEVKDNHNLFVGKNGRFAFCGNTDKRLKAPSQFEFEGKIYFILNEMPRENPLIKALLSRSLIYELTFTYEEMLKILAEFIKMPYKKLKIDKRKEIYNYLVGISDVDCEDLNFRTLIKMYDIYISDKNNWKEMSKNLVKRDEKMYILRKCLREENSVKNARIRFCEETGYSFRHFFNLKNKLMQ